jgi:hypothetical protein
LANHSSTPVKLLQTGKGGRVAAWQLRQLEFIVARNRRPPFLHRPAGDDTHISLRFARQLTPRASHFTTRPVSRPQVKQLTSTGEASVQLDSAPDSPPSASTTTVSLWQENLFGLKAERFFAAEKITSTGVAVLTGATYTGDVPA